MTVEHNVEDPFAEASECVVLQSLIDKTMTEMVMSSRIYIYSGM